MKGAITIFLGIVLAMLLLMHFVAYEAAVLIFGISSLKVLLVLRIVLGFLAISFLPGSGLVHRYNNFFSRLYYRCAVIWLGFATYFFLAACIYGAVLGIGQVVNQNIPDAAIQVLGQALLFVAFLACIYGLLHARHTKIKRVQVRVPNLPEKWRNRTALMVSDLHLGQVNGLKFSRKVADIINSLKPDIIFICGDLYDGVKVDAEQIISPLKDLHAPLGMFFVTGNHEEFADSTHFISAIKNAGIRVLTNEMVEIDGLQIVGVSDREAADEIKFPKILEQLHIHRNTPSILLKHQPTTLGVAEQAGISLQLSGHTHRAQMFPFAYITKMIYHGFDYGLKTYKNMQVMTSSGVGTWGPPFRVGTDSEVVVIEFV